MTKNVSHLTETNERIKAGSKKLKEIEDDPTDSEEKRQLYRNRLDNLNTEQQARLEILSQN